MVLMIEIMDGLEVLGIKIWNTTDSKFFNFILIEAVVRI